MKYSFWFYDSAGTKGFDAVKKLMENNKIKLKILLRKDVKDDIEASDILKSNNIIIVHLSQSGWDNLITNSTTGDIRVRFSSQGYYDRLKNIEYDEKKELYILHIRQKISELEEDDWVNIINGINDDKILKKLIKGDNPNNLKKYFFSGNPSEFDHLKNNAYGVYIRIHNI